MCIARVCLYVPGARTATVLVHLALNRFEDVFSVFRFATKQIGARVVRARGDGLLYGECLKIVVQGHLWGRKLEVV